MAWEPTESEDVMSVEVVPPTTGLLPRLVTPSKKVTVPLAPGTERPASVAVNVTGLPLVEGLGELVIVMVVVETKY
jgi:hypothetical protein